MKIIGNKDTLRGMTVAVKAAAAQNKSPGHMMFVGSAGCGKTTMSKYLAELCGTKCISIPCDSIKNRSDLIPIISYMDVNGYDREGRKIGAIKPTIVFIDEIHGLSQKAQEYLGILMEEFSIPVNSKEILAPEMEKFKYEKEGKLDNTTFNRWAPMFTLVGATTNSGKLTKPFRNRFKHIFSFSPYSYQESCEIVKVHANRLEIKIDDGAVNSISKRGRGIPRILVKYLEECRNYSIVLEKSLITRELAEAVFYENKINSDGLCDQDIKLLKFLYDVNEPIGLENISVSLNDSPQIISEVVEPFLIEKNLMVRVSKGRKITLKGKEYLLTNGYIEDKSYSQRIDIPASKHVERGL